MFGAQPPPIDIKGDTRYLLNTLFAISPALCESVANSSKAAPCLRYILRYLEPTVFFGVITKNTTSLFLDVEKDLKNSSSSIPLLQIVETLKSSCPDIFHHHINNRAEDASFYNLIVDGNTRIIFVTCTDNNSLRSKGRIPLSLTAEGKRFELAYVASTTPLSNAKVLVRHGGQYTKF